VCASHTKKLSLLPQRHVKGIKIKKLLLWEYQFVYNYFQMFIPGEGYSTGTTLDFSITTYLMCTERVNSVL
jgi:hypothetical protein